MHLPAAIRRRITYAAAATLLFGGLPYFARLGANTKPLPEKPAVSSVADAVPTDVERTEFDPPVPAAAREAQPAQAAEEQARPKVVRYTVVEGDTVSTVAEKFGLKPTTILWANDLREGDYLQIGQELKIPAVDGIIHVVQSGDILWNIASEYGVDFTEIVEANPDVDAEALQPGQELLVPGGQPPYRRLSAMVASRGGERQAARAGGFDRWPINGPVTDRFGWRTHPIYGTSHYHDGIDIGVPVGTPVAAVAGGRVTYVGYLGGYGLTVKVDHGDGLVTMYAHLSQATVEVGQSVGAGEQIALSGNTGASTGPHLHFSVFVGGSPVDPTNWLP